MTDLIERLERWLRNKRHKGMLRRFGGLQTCCWCRQCAQDGDSWKFLPWERDLFLDVLTCGVCGGTSLWRWEVGMIWIGPLEPPASAFPPIAYYDIANAALRAKEADNA